MQAIMAFKSMGIEVFMMTGDNKPTALAIAKRIGIEVGNVWANMSPKGKASVITEMIEQEDGVAMVRTIFPFECRACELTMFFYR